MRVALATARRYAHSATLTCASRLIAALTMATAIPTGSLTVRTAAAAASRSASSARAVPTRLYSAPALSTSLDATGLRVPAASAAHSCVTGARLGTAVRSATANKESESDETDTHAAKQSSTVSVGNAFT